MPRAHHAHASYHGYIPAGYHKDYDLSTKNTSVFYNPSTRDVSISFSGTRPLNDPSYRNVLESLIGSDATTDAMITFGHGKKTLRFMESMKTTERTYEKYHKRGYHIHLTGHSLGGRMGADVSSEFKKKGIDLPAEVYNPYFTQNDATTQDNYTNVTAHVNEGDPISNTAVSVPGLNVIQHTQGSTIQAVAPIGPPTSKPGDSCSCLTDGEQANKDDRDWFHRMPSGWNPKDYANWYKSGFTGSTTDKLEAGLSTGAGAIMAALAYFSGVGEAATAGAAATGGLSEGYLSAEAEAVLGEAGFDMTEYRPSISRAGKLYRNIVAAQGGYDVGFGAVKKGFQKYHDIKNWIQAVSHHHGLNQFIQHERGHPGPQSTLVSHHYLDSARNTSRINPNRAPVQPVAPVPG